MAEPYLKIGDVARKVGVSPSVIRSWESLGLARPRRTESKYRLYTADDVKLLKRARFLRKVRGLNAAAIVQLLNDTQNARPTTLWLAGRFVDRGTTSPLAALGPETNAMRYGAVSA